MSKNIKKKKSKKVGVLDSILSTMQKQSKQYKSKIEPIMKGNQSFLSLQTKKG